MGGELLMMKYENGYGNCIVKYIEQLPTGTPILTEEIVDLLVKEFHIDEDHAKKIVNTNLNRLKGKVIENFKKGIYYKPKFTAFGKSPLNPNQVATKMFLKDKDEIIGYETGASLIQQLGLTTQIPKYRYIATNKYTGKGKRVLEDLKLVVRRPRMRVTKDNVLYLQLIDALENKDNVKIDAHNPYRIMSEYIEKYQLDYGKLMAIVKTGYSKEVLLRLSELAAETKL